MSERLRWGVISTANIGRWAVNPAIQASANGELVAVASRDAERARAFAAEHGIPDAHGSYEALLEDDRIDAVYNPLPNSLHHEWTIRAAEAGKHVLCEKPLALNVSECNEMQAAAEANGVKLMEAFMYRFHPRTQKVIDLVRSGAIGEPKAIKSAFTFRLTKPNNIRMDPDLGGGALMDVGCYCVNVSRTIAGAEPVQVTAMANWADTGVDAELAGTLHFESGLMAQFDCSLTMERRESCEVAGADGWLRVDHAFLPGKDAVMIEQHRGRGDIEIHAVEGADEYLLMVEHFADCVLNDRPLRYGPDEAARNMRVIWALYESARGRGRAVEV